MMFDYKRYKSLPEDGIPGMGVEVLLDQIGLPRVSRVYRTKQIYTSLPDSS